MARETVRAFGSFDLLVITPSVVAFSRLPPHAWADIQDHSRKRIFSGEQTKCLIFSGVSAWRLHLKSAALVQFDHIAIRIAHKNSLRSRPKANGTAA